MACYRTRGHSASNSEAREVRAMLRGSHSCNISAAKLQRQRCEVQLWPKHLKPSVHLARAL